MPPYNKSNLLTVVVALILILFAGCGSSTKFIKRIEQMPDKELLSYYHGIKNQIKDLDSQFRIDEHLDNSEDLDIRMQSPFIFGRKGYDLNERKDLIEKELIKRNLLP